MSWTLLSRLSGPCHSLSGWNVSLMVVFGVAVSVGLWLLIGVLAGPAGLVESAEDPQQLVEVVEDSAAGLVNSVVASYARDFSVSYEEALRRLDRVDELQEIIASIRELEVARLAGWGIDHDGVFGAWVSLVGDELPRPAVARIAGNHADLEIRTGAVHSYEELKAAQKRVRSDLPEISEGADPGSNVSTRVVLTGIDVRANSIKVGIDPVSKPRRVKRSASPETQPVSEEVFEAEAARLTEVLANSLGVAVKVVDGRGLGPAAKFRGADGVMGGCTVNFAAKKIGGDYGLITAGHCRNVVYMKSTVLPLVYGWSSPRADAQFHRIPLSDPPHELFDDYKCMIAGKQGVCDVTGTIARVDMLNKYVCHNGNTSGFSCGTITDINTLLDHGCTNSYVVKIECEPVMFTFEGQQLRGCGGDSGSPVFDKKGIAYGLLTEAKRISNNRRPSVQDEPSAKHGPSDCSKGALIIASAVREIEKFLSAEVLTENPTPPSAPVELATAFENDQVSLSWKAPPEGAVQYKVYRRIAAPGHKYQERHTTAYDADSTAFAAYVEVDTEYMENLSDLTSDVEYYYRVVAINNLGMESVPSDFISVLVPGTEAVPPAPVGLEAEIVDLKGVRLSWEKSAGDVDRYEVYRRVAVKGDPYRKIKTITSTSFLDPVSGLMPGVEYYYRVKAVSGAGGVSGWGSGSNYARVVVPAVRGLKTKVYSNGVTFSWEKPVGDVAGFKVFRRVAKPGEAYVEIAERKVPYFWDPVSGLMPGVEYYYRVKAVSGAGGVSGWGSGSNYARVFMPAVRGLKTKVYSNGVTVSWEKPVGDVAGFKVFRRVAKPGEAYVEIAERKVPYLWDPVSGLMPGVEYYYRVKRGQQRRCSWRLGARQQLCVSESTVANLE